jgi:hypothetical protein
MKCIYLILLSTIIVSCSPIILIKKDDLRKIPKGSTKVIAKTAMPPDEAYAFVLKSFAKYGCPVAGTKESMQVICNGKAIEGGTMLKALAFIEPSDTGSSVVLSGEWGLSAMGQAGFGAFTGIGGMSGTEKIVWEGIYATKSCLAFQHLIVLAIDIPGERIRYER